MNQEYLVNKIRNAQIINQPFPHLIIDNLCPEDFFRELKDNIPNDSQFTRYTRLFGRFGIDKDKWAGVWEQFKNYFYNDCIRQELLNKFENTLIMRNEVNSPSDWDVTLTQDTINYKILPHRDGSSKHLTTIFYVTGGLTGTSLYKTQDNTYRTATKIGEVEFVENRLFVFCPYILPGTWHGVEAVNSTKQQRYAVQAFLKLRNAPKFNWNSHGISIPTPPRNDNL